MTVRQRLSTFWLRWHLTSLSRKLPKAERRLTLLQEETTHQLLLLKELSQLQEMALHRQQELREAREFRQTEPSPPKELTPEETQERLKFLLGPVPSTQQTSTLSGRSPLPLSKSDS